MLAQTLHMSTATHAGTTALGSHTGLSSSRQRRSSSALVGASPGTSSSGLPNTPPVPLTPIGSAAAAANAAAW
jgi:hypothetical protein